MGLIVHKAYINFSLLSLPRVSFNFIHYCQPTSGEQGYRKRVRRMPLSGNASLSLSLPPQHHKAPNEPHSSREQLDSLLLLLLLFFVVVIVCE